MKRHQAKVDDAVADAAAEGESAVESVISEAAASAEREGAAATSGDTGSASNGLPAEPASEQIARLESELDAERARYAELMDRYQRGTAEFQNSRRRLEKQMADGIERASEHVVRKLLPVLDDLELAFKNVPASVPEDQVAWVEGFRQIQKKLIDLLKDSGVTEIPSEGAFDPHRHEAVTSEPNDSVASGHIIATLRTGYEANGHVLRPALVRVAA